MKNSFSLKYFCAALAFTTVAFATAVNDPLHAFCYGATPACLDNNTVTPTTTSQPDFGFTISPGPQTGDFLVDILVPNNEDPDPGTLSFSITGTQGGAMNNMNLAGTATLFNGTAWGSGKLADYLGISASPDNPIGAWLPYTQAHGDAGASGYFVYIANLGTNQLAGNSAPLSGPLLNISPGLPPASLIVGFLNTGTADSPDYIATANSGALFKAPGSTVPEPGSLWFAVAGFGALACRSTVKRVRNNHLTR